MTFKWAVEIGDVLTTVTILVSVVALVVSWSKDRLTREAQQADSVRAAAAKVLTKLDRWQAIAISLYTELQPLFIETSEGLQEEYDVIKARDKLWKGTALAQAAISAMILEEEIGTSYVDLLSHFPEVRAQFRTAFIQLTEVEKRVSNEFLEESQGNVLECEGKSKSYTSAQLGNALRTSAAIFEKILYEESEQIIEPLRNALLDIIAKPNYEILGVYRTNPQS